jgi:hypothetical protein
MSASASTILSKPKRKVSHKGALAKGKQFEREISNLLGHIFPEAERMLEYQASKVIGVDIEGTDRIKIQCKNHQNYCSVGTIHEIKIKDPNDIPVLVTKGIRMEAMAVLPFAKLVTLLEIAYGLELPFRTFDYPSAREGACLPTSYGVDAISIAAQDIKLLKSMEEKPIPYSATPRFFSEIFSPSEMAEMELEGEEDDDIDDGTMLLGHELTIDESGLDSLI